MRSAGPRRFAVVLISVFLAFPAFALAQDVLDPAFRSADDTEGADVIGTFTDSLKLLLIEHAFRIGFQDKTRREPGGNFWTDCRRSVRIPGEWGGTDAAWGRWTTSSRRPARLDGSLRRMRSTDTS